MMLLIAKATLAILMALGIGAAARRARASLRHAVYTALFVFLLLLPFAPRVMPEVAVPVPESATLQPVRGELVSAQQPQAEQPTAARPARWSLSIMDVYLAGALLILASLAVGIVRLRRWAARGEVWLDGTRLATAVACESGIRRAVLVILSGETAVPITFGFRRQTIVLPAAAREWDDDSLRRALRHELEHVRRDDWALQPTSYADQLVSLARSLSRAPRVPALAMASPTRLAERVRAILDPSQRRGPHGRVAGVVTIGIMAAALAAFGSVRLVGAPAASVADDLDLYRDVVVRAAESGDVDRLRDLLGRGLRINQTIDGDGTPLLIAAKHGHEDAVTFLLDHGADPNVPSPGDGNPLIAAAGRGEVKMVNLLLDRGARIDEIVPGDENALMTAARFGQEDVVRVLIERGANVNLGTWVESGSERRREWRTPLLMARRSGNEAVVNLLTAAGAR
jgi:beta-lactamase regulating signal transducer with metallopeptidase domain